MNEQLFIDDSDIINKTEAQLFSILFPLFHQPRKPNAFFPVFFWIIFTIQLVALALFRIDNSTQVQTGLSRVVNFVDLSSLTGVIIKTSYWRAATDNICMSNIYQIVGLVLTIITLIVLLVYCLTIDLLIFNFNQKNGGIFSCPDGFFNFIQHLFITIIVFTQRFLCQWEFWRGVASVGVSIAVIVYIIYKQPYYSLKSNFMAQIPWIIFGSVRLCAEIGYLFE
ncbi:MAG: hypothetical protein EZS28_019668 [Streblomastix strix]|uniref:Uncharacterized protein n=1 Tax=Streblomastix strix TaxID=222440 RepID=A0A5J4VQE8_9EUKA|nr:MAG: hypothetical protein EZS28_019668 [Streblomastix strix]